MKTDRLLVATSRDLSGTRYLYALPDGRGHVVYHPWSDDERPRWWRVPSWTEEIERVYIHWGPFGGYASPLEFRIPNGEAWICPVWEPVEDALKSLGYKFPFPKQR